jgi:hypothetical protein
MPVESKVRSKGSSRKVIEIPKHAVGRFDVGEIVTINKKRKK